MVKLLSTAFLLAGYAVQASAVTIDFEPLPGEDPLNPSVPTYFGTETYSAYGFTLTSNVPDSTLIDNDNLIRTAFGAGGTGADSNAMFWGENGSVSTITVTNDSAQLFYLESLDVSSLLNATGQLTVTGYLFGGGTLSQVLNITNSLSTYNLGWNTSGLSSVEISLDGTTYLAPFDLDNVVLSAIPIPAAAWLFASGLGFVGWLGRRLKSA